MKVFAIDPGYEQSAYVIFAGGEVEAHGIESNEALLALLQRRAHTLEEPATVVIEQIESMGMAVGREIFETVFWTGRFYEAALNYLPVERMTRHAVKLQLCFSRRAKDAEVRLALIDRFGATKERAIGTKKLRGPLFGIRSHEWAALALAVAWSEKQAEFPAAESNGEKASA